jgi:ribosomal protein S18 acetylase RimI-like enzyme
VSSVLALSRAMNAEDGRSFDEAGEAAVRLLCLGDMAARCWLARGSSRDKAIGYIILTLGFSIEHGGRDGFIDEFYVIPEMRGLGLGRRMMQIAEEAARALGVRTLHLEVENRNKTAQAIYRKTGWRDTQRKLLSKKL